MTRRYLYSLLGILFVSLWVTAIYYNSLSGGFYHDDLPNLVANPEVKITDLNLTSIEQAATSSESGKLKRPISMLSFAMNYYFFGDQPLSFRITNVLLHISTGIIIFLLVYQLKNLSILNLNNNEKNSLYLSLIIAIICLIHPVHVSTVAYIVQRMTILAALFSMLAILFYVLGRKRHISSKKTNITYYLLSAFAFIAAVLCKENAILTLLILASIELIIFRQHLSNREKHNQNKLIYICSGLILFLTIFYGPTLITYYAEETLRIRDFTLEERLLTQLRIVPQYIIWFFIPNIQELGLFHDDIKLSSSFLNPITTLLGLIFIIILITIAIVFRKKSPLLSLGICWFFIGHILESTFIPLELLYEHRNYLPYIGLTIATCATLLHTFHKLNNIAQLFLVSIIVILLSSITSIRASHWSSELSFAYFETLNHPKSVRANHTLGMVYYKLAINDNPEYEDKAIKYLLAASKLDSRHIQPEAALIQLSFKLQKPASPEWINFIAEKLEHSPPRLDHANLLKQLTACIDNKCILPIDASEFLFDSALSNNRLEKFPATHAATLSAKAHFLLERQGSRSEAENLMKSSIAISPHRTQYYADYVNLLLLLERPEDALIILENAYISDNQGKFTYELDTLKNKINSSTKKK